MTIHPSHIEAGMIDIQVASKPLYQTDCRLGHGQIGAHPAALGQIIMEAWPFAPIAGNHLTAHHNNAQIAHNRQ